MVALNHSLACFSIIIIYVYIQPAPGEYQYSGRHDTGPLIPPKEENDDNALTRLIASIQQAKVCSDTYLTEIIQREQQQQQSAAAAVATKDGEDRTLPISKKAKHERDTKRHH